MRREAGRRIGSCGRLITGAHVTWRIRVEQRRMILLLLLLVVMVVEVVHVVVLVVMLVLVEGRLADAAWRIFAESWCLLRSFPRGIVILQLRRNIPMGLRRSAVQAGAQVLSGQRLLLPISRGRPAAGAGGGDSLASAVTRCCEGGEVLQLRLELLLPLRAPLQQQPQHCRGGLRAHIDNFAACGQVVRAVGQGCAGAEPHRHFHRIAAMRLSSSYARQRIRGEERRGEVRGTPVRVPACDGSVGCRGLGTKRVSIPICMRRAASSWSDCAARVDPT